MQTPSYLDVLDDLFYVFDETRSLHEWNQSVNEVTGYSDTTLAKMSPADFFEDGDAERIDAAVETAFDTGRATAEATLVTADGDRIPYEFTGHRITEGGTTHLVGIGRDVSARSRERDRLRARERVLREMYDVIADRRLAFTEQVEALLELGRDELDTDFGSLSRIEGEDYVFEIVDADDDSINAGDVVPVSATNCEIAATNRETLVLGDVARDAPGETDRAGYTDWGISCYIGAPVFTEETVYGTFCFYDTEPREDQFSEWEVTLVDLMSRWVSYELQQTRARDRLKAQNEKLDKFASLVSHDLRNPLNVIEGSLELAEETGDLEQLSHAREALDRMDTLIDDLLQLARSGAVIDETETVDLATLAQQCWNTVATENATLQVTTERSIEADRTRLQQLLENLIRNAVEHGSTSPDSQARQDAAGASASEPSVADAPEDAVEHGGEGVTVTIGDLPDGFFVEDDGVGIPEEDREKVLESGFTTAEQGTGFGLAIVAEIAAAHGWAMDVTESEAGGARFEFSGLPG